ncbi:MAG: GNAT family N-acetyltransferase [Thermoplasmata archaeon]|nr:GNAT family N-acetyltransferase [Thermoplasmata archaeon]
MTPTDSYGPATYRLALPADANRLAEVHIRVLMVAYRGIDPQDWLDSLPQQLEERRARWKDRLSTHPDDPVQVAEVDPAGIVGYAVGGRARGEPPIGFEGELISIYLLPEHQRRGIGRELVRRVARSLIASGFQGMIVRVLSANPARIFYERLGARALGIDTVSIGGQELEETVYGWSNIDLFFPP